MGAIRKGDGIALFSERGFFLWLRGLPRAQSDPVASHFVASSWSPVYWLKICRFLLIFEVLYCTRSDIEVNCVAIIIVGDDSGSGSMWLICGFVSSTIHC